MLSMLLRGQCNAGTLRLYCWGISANVCCSASLNASVVQQLLLSHLSSSAVSQGFWDRGATDWAVIMKGHKGGGVLKLLYFTMKHAQPEQCHTRGTRSEAEVEFQMVSWPLRRQICFQHCTEWKTPKLIRHSRGFWVVTFCIFFVSENYLFLQFHSLA